MKKISRGRLSSGFEFSVVANGNARLKPLSSYSPPVVDAEPGFLGR